MRACRLVFVFLMFWPLSVTSGEQPDEAAFEAGGDREGGDSWTRPDEDALFGGSPDQSAVIDLDDSAEGQGAGAQSGAEQREQNLFGTESSSLTLSQHAAPEDPLRIGGQIYSRFLTTFREENDPDLSYLEETSLNIPTLVDVYLDARPNEGLRGMAEGRFTYNPAFASDGSSTDSTDSTSPYNLASALTASSGKELDVALTQLWLRFDIAHRVFVTAGRQHVRWGTGRFWSPTDYLQPVRTDPLEPFDSREGLPMIKLQLPWEARGWNFYALALLDRLREVSDSSSEDSQDGSSIAFPSVMSMDEVGAALRAELVLGTVELGIDGVFQHQRAPRFGLDFSGGVGPIDLHGEVALGSDKLLWRVANPDTTDIFWKYESWQASGLSPRSSLGLEWSRMVHDNDTLTLGSEYFYNALGYDSQDIYFWLLLQDVLTQEDVSSIESFYDGITINPEQDYTPLYLGKHYAGAYLSLEVPGTSADLRYTLTTLGNLSDRSFLTRLDVTATVLTHMRIEAYAALHYGSLGGEFRQNIDSDDATVVGTPLDVYYPGPIVDVGISLKIGI